MTHHNSAVTLKEVLIGLGIAVALFVMTTGILHIAKEVSKESLETPAPKFTFYETVHLNMAGTFYASCREGIVQKGWYMNQKYGWAYKVLAACKNENGVIVQTELELGESTLEKIK